MTIAQPPMWLTLAFALMMSGVGAASAVADEKPGHSHEAGHEHADGHAHHAHHQHGDAESIAYVCPMACVPAQASSGKCSVCKMQLVREDLFEAEKEIKESLAELSKEGRAQVVAQRFCPIMEHTRLGATGTPHKVMIEGKAIFVCCEGCIEDASAGGRKTLAKVEKLVNVSATMEELSPEDRAAAEAQKYCAIATKNYLGSMGAPIKLEIKGKPVFLCCKGCVKKANANPDATLATVHELIEAGEGHDHDGHDHEGHDHDGHKHGDHDHEGHDHAAQGGQ